MTRQHIGRGCRQQHGQGRPPPLISTEFQSDEPRPGTSISPCQAVSDGSNVTPGSHASARGTLRGLSEMTTAQ